MSIAALKMSLRPSSREFTYGWHRAEIIGTMMSVVFLLTVTIWLLVEATNRIVSE
jgi:Co/Zn/Cd efflux system component